jgi:hypothetical protein
MAADRSWSLGVFQASATPLTSNPQVPPSNVQPSTLCTILCFVALHCLRGGGLTLLVACLHPVPIRYVSHLLGCGPVSCICSCTLIWALALQCPRLVPRSFSRDVVHYCRKRELTVLRFVFCGCTSAVAHKCQAFARKHLTIMHLTDLKQVRNWCFGKAGLG